MILESIHQTNLNFLYDCIKLKFSKTNYNDLEPKVHLSDILNKVSIYFEFSDLSYLDSFYLKRFIGKDFPIFVDRKNSKSNPIKIGLYDYKSTFTGIGLNKKFKTIIHLSGNLLMPIFKARPYEFFLEYFKQANINPSAEYSDIDESHLLNYIFHVFIQDYYAFINRFIVDTDLLVDARIHSDFHSIIKSKSSTDIEFVYASTPIGKFEKSDFENQNKLQELRKYKEFIDDESISYVFSVNSTLVAFLLFTNNFLNYSDLLDFTDFKVVSKSDILCWIQAVLNQSPNKIAIYQEIQLIKDKFNQSLNSNKTLNRYNFIVGGNSISYTIKVNSKTLTELKMKFSKFSSESVENAEVQIILNKIDKFIFNTCKLLI